MKKILFFSLKTTLLGFFLNLLFFLPASAAILFQDNFDSGNANQWTPVLGNPSLWKVVNGRYGARIEDGSTIIDTVAGTITTPDYIIELDILPIAGEDKNIDFRWSNNNTKYEVHFNNSGAHLNFNGETAAYFLQNGNTYHIKITLENQHIQFYVNNDKLFDEIDANYQFGPNEQIGLRISTGASFPTEVWFDNIVVTSIETNTDLTVPLLKQTSEPWQSNVYDAGNVWSPQDPTINRWGCALTSAAMVFDYHGFSKLPDGKDLDPGTLNSWLKNQPDGYVRNGLVNWISLSRLSFLSTPINNITNFDALEYTRVNSTDSAILADDLSNNRPDILEEPGHFVVAKGINGNTFNINDPFYDRDTLNDGYSNTFLSLGRYTPSNTDLSYIMLVVNQNTQLSFGNTSGNLLGEQFIQQPLTSDATPSATSGDSVRILYLPKPQSGTYFATVSANIDTQYMLDVFLYDENGNVKKVSQNGSVSPNSKDTFTINFNKQNSNDSDTERIVLFKDVLDDLKELRKLNLIKTDHVKNNLTKEIQNAEKFFKKGIKFKNEVLIKLKNFEKQIKEQRGKRLTEEGYQILLYDLTYLRNHLIY